MHHDKVCLVFFVYVYDISKNPIHKNANVVLRRRRRLEGLFRRRRGIFSLTLEKELLLKILHIKIFSKKNPSHPIFLK
jgi:CRISPR/Cas system-associated endoribonuclease Cas2